MSNPVIVIRGGVGGGKTAEAFRGREIDFVEWDAWDFDEASFVEAFDRLQADTPYHFVSFDIGRPEPLPMPDSPRDKLFVTGFISPIVGKWERPGPNRRNFKRNARKGK